MLEIIKSIDRSLFLFINGANSHFFDIVFYWSSNKFIWLPLYIIFLYLIVKYYKKESILVIFSFIVLIAMSDLLSVHGFKNVFMRLRPCHEPSLAGLVHQVYDKCGGSFGFYSSHASNHFALATFLHFFIGKKLKYFSLLIFIWAAIVSYSRVYLGVHYPSDVLAGAIMGIILSFIMYRVYNNLANRIKE